MVAPTQIPPSRQAAQSVPAFTEYKPYQFSGWLSLVGMSLLVVGLLAGIMVLSPTGSALPNPLPFPSGGGSEQLWPGQPPRQVPLPGVSTTTTLAPVVPCTARDTGAFRQSITIGPDQHVCGNVVAFGGNVTIDGVVDGNVTLVGGTGDISGTVNGNITAVDANIHLWPGAVIDGSIQVVGGSVQRDPGVLVSGSIEQGIDPQHIVLPGWQGISSSYDFPWSRLLFWLLASIAITALFPRHLALVRRAARDSLPSACFLGIVCSIIGPVLAIGLFFTCIGIPFALLVAVALVVASVVGTVALGLWLGERLLGQSRTARRASMFPAMVGVTLLALAQTAPCVGGIVTVLTCCTGLGASILALLYSRRRAVWTPDGLL